MEQRFSAAETGGDGFAGIRPFDIGGGAPRSSGRKRREDRYYGAPTAEDGAAAGRPAGIGLHRLWWMLLAIVSANILFVQVATALFGKSGFSAVPVVRAGTAGTTLLLVTGWWLLSNQWDGRFAFSRRTGALALLLVVWLCLGLYYAAPLGYVASDTFFLLHSVLFLLVFHTYFQRGSAYQARRGDAAVGPYDRWFPISAWLVLIAAAGVFFPQVELPPSIALVIVVGVIGRLIAARYDLTLLVGGLLMMIYAVTGDRAFLFAVVVSLLGGLYISRRSRSLQVIAGVGLLAGIVYLAPSLTGGAVSHQKSRVLEAWDSFVAVTNGGRIEELPVPLYQRVYEAQLVAEKLASGGIGPTLLGYGAGASLDMSRSNDISVAEASLLGLERVHNIHLLPFMVVYRYGVLGLVLFALLIFGILRQMVLFRRLYVRQGTHLGLLLAGVYVLAWLTFAFPAGGFIFENPLLFICIAAVWAGGKSERLATHPEASALAT